MRTLLRLLKTKKELFFTPFLLASFVANAAEPAAFRCWDGSFAYQYFSVIPNGENVTVKLEGQAHLPIANSTLGLEETDSVRELEFTYPKAHCRAADDDTRIVACVMNATQETTLHMTVRYVSREGPFAIKEKSIEVKSADFESVKELNLGRIWQLEQTKLNTSRIGRLRIVIEGPQRWTEHTVSIQGYPSTADDTYSCESLNP